METFEAIRSRRSVKRFDPEHRLTDGEIEQLVGAAVLSPTSFNIQNWRFVVVTDPELKRRIRQVGYDQPQFSDASAVIFLCGDLQAHARDPERYWRNVPEEQRRAIVGMIRAAYDGRPERQHDEALRSCGMAAQTLMLAARAMGYDTCPMVGFDFAAVAELIRLPADHEIVMAVAVGKRLADPHPRPGPLPLAEVMFRDRFPER